MTEDISVIQGFRTEVDSLRSQLEAVTKERDEEKDISTGLLKAYDALRARNEKLQNVLKLIDIGTGKTSWTDQLLAREALREAEEG